MIIVGLSIIATVFVLQYHHHDPNGSKMPKWVSVSHPYIYEVLFFSYFPLVTYVNPNLFSIVIMSVTTAVA